MAYEYIKEFFHVRPNIGDRVRVHETKSLGTIAPEVLGNMGYVMVKLDGVPFAIPHPPTHLDYLGKELK